MTSRAARQDRARDALRGCAETGPGSTPGERRSLPCPCGSQCFDCCFPRGPQCTAHEDNGRRCVATQGHPGPYIGIRRRLAMFARAVAGDVVGVVKKATQGTRRRGWVTASIPPCPHCGDIPWCCSEQKREVLANGAAPVLRLVRMLREGGTIVSSNDCSEVEIAAARACGRFYVDEDHFGYVYRPRATPGNSEGAKGATDK